MTITYAIGLGDEEFLFNVGSARGDLFFKDDLNVGDSDLLPGGDVTLYVERSRPSSEREMKSL